MRIVILGSGSSGNSALVEAGSAAAGGVPTRVLIDAGLSKRALEDRLLEQAGGLLVEHLDAVLVTHEHSDHLGCAAELGRPLFAPAAARRKKELVATRVLAGQPFTIGTLRVEPVDLPHDAEETVGYLVSDGRHRVGILTDCGLPDERVARAYAGCDVLVLEANHDPLLLLDGPYPPSLQRRVRGPRGHLSNAQAARMLELILAAGPPPRVLVAAHLSLKNNRPERVEAALRPLLPAGTDLIFATRHGAPEIRLPLPGGAPRREQLGLPLMNPSAETP